MVAVTPNRIDSMTHTLDLAATRKGNVDRMGVASRTTEKSLIPMPVIGAYVELHANPRYRLNAVGPALYWVRFRSDAKLHSE